MTAEQPTTAAEARYVRDLVSTVSQRMVGLYESTKTVSPRLGAGIETIEKRFVEPYKEPVLGKLKEATDPLVDRLDNKIADIVPQAKDTVTSLNETWVKPSGEFVNRQIQTAQSQVAATEEYLLAQRQAVLDGVHNHVIRPSYEKVVAPTGDYVEALKEQAKQRTEYVSRTTRDVYQNVLERADQTVDHMLPETDDSDGAVDADKLTRKIASRIGKRAQGAAYKGVQRASEVSQVDILSYAREGESIIGRTLDRIIKAFPSPEAAATAVSYLCDRLPENARKPVQQLACKLIVPPVSWGLAKVATVLLFLRTYFPNTDNKIEVASQRDSPATKPTGSPEVEADPTCVTTAATTTTTTTTSNTTSNTTGDTNTATGGKKQRRKKTKAAASVIPAEN